MTEQIGCNCITLTDAAIAEHNTELGVDFQIDRRTGHLDSSIALVTRLIEKRRGARPVSVLATYCPICGTRYREAHAEVRP